MKSSTLGKTSRCEWVSDDPIYIEYHDKEWGVPVYDDRTMFEFLTLESAQAGLSWITILKRREGYRRVFAEFNVEEVAQFSEEDIQKALADSGIVRNKLKIRATVQNAKVFIKIQDEFGSFSNYIWRFVGGKQIDNKPINQSDVSSTSEISNTISRDLKSRGMNFVGPTIIYAHMQATGLVNDHLINCITRHNA